MARGGAGGGAPFWVQHPSPGPLGSSTQNPRFLTASPCGGRALSPVAPMIPARPAPALKEESLASRLLDCLGLAVGAIIHSIQLFNGAPGEGTGDQGRTGHHSHREVDVAGVGPASSSELSPGLPWLLPAPAATISSWKGSVPSRLAAKSGQQHSVLTPPPCPQSLGPGLQGVVGGDGARLGEPAPLR